MCFQVSSYHPCLSQFYGVDPLAHKYPNMSPFTYTADNPVMLVDPDGRAPMLDYFTKSGKRIGSDGINDGRKAVVTDWEEIKQIKRNNRKGQYTNLENVKSAVVLPDDKVLNEALDVFKRTEANGGHREEASLFLTDGTLKRLEPGPYVEDLNSNDPYDYSFVDENVEISIHSHLLFYEYDLYSPAKASPDDKETFSKIKTNIIVGIIKFEHIQEPNTIGKYKINIQYGMTFYRFNQKVLQLELRAVKRIINN